MIRFEWLKRESNAIGIRVPDVTGTHLKTHMQDAGPSILVWMIPFFSETKCFLKSFRRGQLPHKFVNLSFSIANTRNELTELCGH